jgi:hypothetical protein
MTSSGPGPGGSLVPPEVRDCLAWPGTCRTAGQGKAGPGQRRLT